MSGLSVQAHITMDRKIVDRGIRFYRNSLWRIARAGALPFLALASGMLLSSLAYTQEFHADIPTYAHYSATEQGWACNDGFKQVAGFCIGDMQNIPSQNAVEVYDGQWRCRPGYRRTNGTCTIPTAPEHATLIGEGDRWECDWGFRKVASRCEEINPPAHAYLDASGRDWACFPGFERVADHCVRMPSTETDTGAASGSHDAPISTPDSQAVGRF
jgi:hypothetical protein